MEVGGLTNHTSDVLFVIFLQVSIVTILSCYNMMVKVLSKFGQLFPPLIGVRSLVSLPDWMQRGVLRS